MNLKRTLLAMGVLSSALAFAQQRDVKNVKDRSGNYDWNAFDRIPAKDLTPQTLYYTQDILSFQDWKTQRPMEKELLGLVPGYEEPEVVITTGEPTIATIAEELRLLAIETESIKNSLDLRFVTIRFKEPIYRETASALLKQLFGSKVKFKRDEETLIELERVNPTPKKIIEKLQMYLVKTRTVLDRPVEEIHAKDLVSVDMIRSLDKTIKHWVLSTHNALPYVVGTREVIDNFNQCNADGSYIRGVKDEIDLSHLKSQKWCEGGLCLESCYIFPEDWRRRMGPGSRLADKDQGLALQSELRTFSDESELRPHRLPASVSLESISLPGSVRGGMVWSIFYMNQVFQFGKLVSILQAHPENPRQTVVTNFVALGIRHRTWKKYGLPLQLLLKGELRRSENPNDDQPIVAVNTNDGITAGVPHWSKNMSLEMAKSLGKKK
ncbi:MAG: hypothetical protein AB7G93_13805 [Bdellovibrionales bacterium]